MKRCVNRGRKERKERTGGECKSNVANEGEPLALLSSVGKINSNR